MTSLLSALVKRSQRASRGVLCRSPVTTFCWHSRASFGSTAKAKQFSASSVQPATGDLSVDCDERETALDEILEQKKIRNLTFDDIAAKLGYTNIYTAQILLLQAPLNPSKAETLKQILRLSDETLNEMVKSPQRRYDIDIAQEPHVYRMLEACQHNGEAMKMIINEKFGDGIMSAIDFYMNIEKVTGAAGEERVVITFDGKFLPFIEQNISETVTVTNNK